MRPIQLDERLACAAAFVRQGARAADIGCDHGKLTVSLAMSGKAGHVIAVDVRPDPLEKARALIRRAGVETLAECRLGDGLSALSPQEADDIVIAGVSGVTVIGMLQAAPAFWTKEKRFILVPATKVNVLRKWLCENGFAIQKEEAALAAGHPYAVLCAAYTGIREEKTPLFYALGLLAKEKTPQAQAYRQKVYAELRKIADGRREDPRYPQENREAVELLRRQVENTL